MASRDQEKRCKYLSGNKKRGLVNAKVAKN